MTVKRRPFDQLNPNRRLHPGRTFEIGLDRLGVFPPFHEGADHAAGGKPERKREYGGKADCGTSVSKPGHVCDSWLAGGEV